MEECPRLKDRRMLYWYQKLSMFTWLKEHKKLVQIATAMVVIGVVVFVAQEANANAAEATVDWAVSGFVNLIAWIVNALAKIVMQIVVAVMGYVLMPVLKYSDFIHHPVVIEGWEVVRDLANTGFVALMLIMAFGTMFGISRMQWSQNLPRLVIAAIAVNFSRLIVGFFIDIGQVVMNAFVNAIQQIGPANLLELVKMRQSQAITGDGGAFADSGNALVALGSAIFALIQAIITLVVILIMTAVLLYRVIILWVLIILSPAAFLAGAAEGMIKGASGIYSNWWSKLSAAIMIGPVLAFFLWLSLAAVSNSAAGLTDGFDPLNDNPVGSTGIIANESAGPTHLLGFVIGIALLLAGLEMAQQSASQIGGLAQKAVSSGARVSKQIAAAPVALAGGATLAGLRFGGRQAKKGARAGIGLAGDKISGRLTEKRAEWRKDLKAGADREIARGGVLGAVTGIGGLAVRGALKKEDEREKKIVSDIAKKEKGFMSEAGIQEKLDFFNENTKAGSSRTNRIRSMEIASGFVTDEKKFDELWNTDKGAAKKMLKSAQDHYKNTDDKTSQDKVDTMLKKNPRWKYDSASDMAEAIDNMSEKDRKGLSAGNWKSADFVAATAQAESFKEFFHPDADTRKNARKGYAGAFTKGADIIEPNRAEIGNESTRVQRGRDVVNGMDSGDDRDNLEKGNEALNKLINGDLSQSLAAALKGVKFEDIDIADMQSRGLLDEDKLADAMKKALQTKGSSKNMFSLLAADAAGSSKAKDMTAMLQRKGIISELKRIAGGSGGAAKAARANLAVHNGDISDYGYTSGAGFGGDKAKEREFRSAVSSNPQMLLNVNVASSVAANGGKNDLGRVVAEAFSKESLNGLLKSLDASRGGDHEEMYRQSAAQIGKILEQQTKIAEQTGSGYTDVMKKQLNEALQHFERRIKTQI